MTALALAVVVSSLGAPAALAAPNAAEREARRHFAEAELSYRAGHYADALAKYQAGYAATPLPGFLVNIAQCQRRLGDLKAARATYREFVLVAPDSRLVPEVADPHQGARHADRRSGLGRLGPRRPSGAG